MVKIDLIEKIRYPDEKPATFDSRIEYHDALESEKLLLSISKGQDIIDSLDTIAELERRWEERQRKSTVRITDASPAFNRLQAQA